MSWKPSARRRRRSPAAPKRPAGERRFQRGLSLVAFVLPCVAASGAPRPSDVAARAQDYPSKPIRLIVPYAPGGSSDIIARLLGQHLSASMGQPFVVDNRPGAGGIVGTALLAKSAPDGYSLLLQDMPHTINPAVYGQVPYDPVRDFTPVTLVARAPQWLFVNPALPAKTVRELVVLAKADPRALKIGSAGNGSGTHLMAELLMRGAGITLTHVPYKGAGPAVSATVGARLCRSCNQVACGRSE
jgi:tripartite-type tricarboxylate transporter receptor subunit TctC